MKCTVIKIDSGWYRCISKSQWTILIPHSLLMSSSLWQTWEQQNSALLQLAGSLMCLRSITGCVGACWARMGRWVAAAAASSLSLASVCLRNSIYLEKSALKPTFITFNINIAKQDHLANVEWLTHLTLGLLTLLHRNKQDFTGTWSSGVW